MKKICVFLYFCISVFLSIFLISVNSYAISNPIPKEKLILAKQLVAIDGSSQSMKESN